MLTKKETVYKLAFVILVFWGVYSDNIMFLAGFKFWVCVVACRMVMNYDDGGGY